MKRNRRAGVEDRWTKTVRDDDGHTRTVLSANNGKGKRWRARYVDDQGREHAKAFTRKIEAQAWLDNVVTVQVTGSYVDPRYGKITFSSFTWSGRAVRCGCRAPGTRWTWPSRRSRSVMSRWPICGHPTSRRG
jgi:hypothetical protein